VADAVVDASVWVSRLVPVDAHHRASVAWFEAREEGDLLLAPALMPPEVAGALSRRTRDAALAWRAVRSLLRLPALRLAALDEELSERAARLAADLALRGADAVYAALAQALGVPLATLDREQRERARRRVEVEWLG
jgi:predicted nucleic acid-binding protein